METKLTPVEARVLGCLIEKELSTPEYYPLSLNALVNACNQKNNRDPVMALGEAEVAGALAGLRQHGLAMQAAERARVARYGHNLRGKLQLGEEEIALLCELLVRGPQTAGELRGRAARLHPFPEPGAVEAVLQRLAAREPPLVVKLARQPGRKEQRWAHLMGEPPPSAEEAAAPSPAAPVPASPAAPVLPSTASPPPAPAAAPPGGGTPAAAPTPGAPSAPPDERVAVLQEELRALRDEVELLKDELRRLERRVESLA
jgi:uncharacterized protein YceH (UPF0502 family)